MNLLTAEQLKVFDNAFVCIMRVASAGIKNITEIRIDKQRLPIQYFDLLEEIGGISKLEHHFCPMNKEQTLKWLIKRCYRDRQQPSDFIFQGNVSQEIINTNVVEHTFKDAN